MFKIGGTGITNQQARSDERPGLQEDVGPEQQGANMGSLPRFQAGEMVPSADGHMIQQRRQGIEMPEQRKEEEEEEQRVKARKVATGSSQEKANGDAMEQDEAGHRISVLPEEGTAGGNVQNQSKGHHHLQELEGQVSQQLLEEEDDARGGEENGPAAGRNVDDVADIGTKEAADMHAAEDAGTADVAVDKQEDEADSVADMQEEDAHSADVLGEIGADEEQTVGDAAAQEAGAECDPHESAHEAPDGGTAKGAGHEEACPMSTVYGLLSRLKGPGTFCAGGFCAEPCLGFPTLHVAGVGTIGLPLGPEQAQALARQCEQAPFGRGAATVVDTAVRNSWQLGPGGFALQNPAWDGRVQALARKASSLMGVGESVGVRAELYKLLLYETGGFFKSHRDTEKTAGCVRHVWSAMPFRKCVPSVVGTAALPLCLPCGSAAVCDALCAVLRCRGHVRPSVRTPTLHRHALARVRVRGPCCTKCVPG